MHAIEHINFSPLIELPFQFIRSFNQEDSKGDAQSLNIENVNGIFIVTFFGCGLALMGGYIELCYLSYKNAKKAKVLTCHNLTVLFL